MTNATRYILAHDGQSQIAVEMTDALHRFCWGWMRVSTGPHDVPTVEADPVVWVREQKAAWRALADGRLARIREAAGVGRARMERAA